MAITRWNPNTDLTNYRTAWDQLFNDFFNTTPSMTGFLNTPSVGLVPLNIAEEGDKLVVTAPVPGVKPQDIDIKLHDNVLTISGETNFEQEEKQTNYLLKENRYTSFARSVMLPYPIAQNQVQADVTDGVLCVILPKTEAAKAQKIPVTTGTNLTTKALGTTPEVIPNGKKIPVTAGR